jgi:hypothetical protein
MKVITSVTTHVTAEGTRISFTYSDVNENGDIVTSNERVTKIITDKKMKDHVTALNDYALSLLED